MVLNECSHCQGRCRCHTGQRNRVSVPAPRRIPSRARRNPELKDARQACWIEGGPHFMNLAVYDMEDRNAGHAHPLACGCPSAHLSRLRTGKRPTSRNTITLCNKVCDGEVN